MSMMKRKLVSLAGFMVGLFGLSVDARLLLSQEPIQFPPFDNVAKNGALPELKKDYNVEFHPSLKGLTTGPAGLKIFAADPERVKFENDALRITLPTGTRRPRIGDGVATDFGIRGDFDVAVAFEILKDFRGNLPYPTDLKLVAVPNEPAERDIWHRSNQNRASIGRECPYVESPGGFVANVTTWLLATDKALIASKREPTPGPNFDKFGRQDYSWVEPQTKARIAAKTLSGRLRLVRSGATLFFLCSDGAAADFELVHKHEFGTKTCKACAFSRPREAPAPRSTFASPTSRCAPTNSRNRRRCRSGPLRSRRAILSMSRCRNGRGC
jgi:hypothetical protein